MVCAVTVVRAAEGQKSVPVLDRMCKTTSAADLPLLYLHTGHAYKKCLDLIILQLNDILGCRLLGVKRADVFAQKELFAPQEYKHALRICN